MNAFSHDDRATGPNAPDGKIDISGRRPAPDAPQIRSLLRRRLAGQGPRRTQRRAHRRGAQHARRPGLDGQLLGPASNGTGKLLIFGGQYDLSLARLLREDDFHGDGPDIFLSVFALGTNVTSDDKAFTNFRS